MKNSKKDIEKLLKSSRDNFFPDTSIDSSGREGKDFSFLQPTTAVKPERKQYNHRKSLAFKFASALAAFMLLAGIGFGSYFGYAGSESNTIYLDINPSMYIVTDRLDRVKSAGTYNQEAVLVLDGLRIKGKPLKSALEMILDASYEKDYLTASDENEILVGVEGHDKKKNGAKEEKIKGFLFSLNARKPYRFNFDVREAKSENKNDAKAYGISPSKYALIKEIIEAEPSYIAEALKNKSVKELKTILSAVTEC